MHNIQHNRHLLRHIQRGVHHTHPLLPRVFLLQRSFFSTISPTLQQQNQNDSTTTHRGSSNVSATGRTYVPVDSPQSTSQHQSSVQYLAQEKARAEKVISRVRTVSTANPDFHQHQQQYQPHQHQQQAYDGDDGATMKAHIPKFKQQGSRSSLSTILMRLVISAGLGAACLLVAYIYYVTNKDKLSFADKLEQEKKNKANGASGGGGDSDSGNTVKKGFFNVGRTKTLRNQYIVTRSRIYELEVCRGEVTNEKTDAIFVAINPSLDIDSSSSLTQQLIELSGDREGIEKQLKKALTDQESLKPGQVVATEISSKAKSKLGCKYLIHVVTPLYEGGQGLEMLHLSQAIYNGLMEADKLELKSVSIPAIGTGANHRFPRDKCAPVLFDAVFMYFNDRDNTVAAARQNKMSLHNVRFINSDEQSIDAFLKEYDHKKKMGKILV